MPKSRVVRLEPKERILKKAKRYIDDVELVFEEWDQAVPMLIKAMKHADRDLKQEIMCVLGSFAKEDVVWPLFEMMTNPSEGEEIRHDAAIQLSVIAPFLKESQPLMDRLVKEVESPDPERRLYGTSAMGWRGHFQVAVPLIERLYDADPRVQEAAVDALCNLRDDRILGLLLDRLEHGPVEQKRVILFNLWRFHAKKEEVTEVYLRYLNHDNAKLRFAALVCLKQVGQITGAVEVYRKCLRDSDRRIRGLALRRVAEEGTQKVVESLREEIRLFLGDPDMEIKDIALKILKRRQWL